MGREVSNVGQASSLPHETWLLAESKQADNLLLLGPRRADLQGDTALLDGQRQRGEVLPGLRSFREPADAIALQREPGLQVQVQLDFPFRGEPAQGGDYRRMLGEPLLL